MGRWTQYDEDDYRLPEGMKRIGYDSDTSQYYFHDMDGSIWAGSKGAEFGEMRRVSSGPTVTTTDDEDVESGQPHDACIDLKQLIRSLRYCTYRIFIRLSRCLKSRCLKYLPKCKK